MLRGLAAIALLLGLAGFTPVSIGAPILRVEAAVASALGQLLLLQRLRK